MMKAEQILRIINRLFGDDPFSTHLHYCF